MNTSTEQNPCNYCGKTLREQMNGCTINSCYRQYLPKKEKTTEQLKWTDELAKELCEYVGLRVGKGKDIRQQVELLTEDFKQSKMKKEEPNPTGFPNEYCIGKGDTFKGQEVVDICLRDNKIFFSTEPKKQEEPEEWEILLMSFIDRDGKEHYRAMNEMCDDECKIHSVKRLSDGEVFTVVDNTNFGVIEGFSINDKNEIWASIKGKDSAAFFNDLHHKPLPKEEPIPTKVLGLLDGINTMNPPYGKYHTLVTNQSIPQDKYEPIKEAISNVLNKK